ncbi:MAG TPA: zf-HC2 domain-containing protein [Vicinamibacterales bacterium]|nr:zf-HC2 domain-containing protein [Vicinamibacterales bacterium]
MATDFDRDDRLHGLLRDTLRGQPASGPCIDAATLAAWAEDALTPEETAAADAHLATCERCRELAATLSTMADAEGAPAANVVPFAARPNGRWKVIVGAMGAIAASALIWVAVRDESPTLDTTSAANRAAQSQDSGVGGSVASPATSPARPAEGAATAPPPRADAASEAERRQGQQGQRPLGTPRPEAKLARENSARTAEPRQFNATPPPTAVEPPPARVAAPPPPPPAAVPPPPQPAPAAPPATRSSTGAASPLADTLFAMPIVAEFVVGADLQAAEGQQGQAFGAVADRSRAGGGGRGAGGGGGRGGAGAAGGVAQKPTNAVVLEPVRWRLRGSSTAAVERSNDGGTTWLPVPIPVTPQLASGSAPANTVCWLAGRAGTVLLSTDGTTFRQVTKPADADLVSVRATDARSATVRTIDGRTFTTTDGGLTWTLR